MQLLDFDFNQEDYSFQSRSYMLPLIKDFSRGEPLHFFTSNFLPLMEALNERRENADQRSIQPKKYEALIQQCWETLPAFVECPDKLGEEVGTILPMLEKIIK